MKVRDAVWSFWIKNAMARHGVLPGEPNVTADTVAPAKSGIMPAILAAALTAAGLPIAGGLVDWYFSKDKPAAVAPAEPTAQQDGSLYQFLEDHNLHLPE